MVTQVTLLSKCQTAHETEERLLIFMHNQVPRQFIAHAKSALTRCANVFLFPGMRPRVRNQLLLPAKCARTNGTGKRKEIRVGTFMTVEAGAAAKAFTANRTDKRPLARMRSLVIVTDGAIREPSAAMLTLRIPHPGMDMSQMITQPGRATQHLSALMADVASILGTPLSYTVMLSPVLHKLLFPIERSRANFTQVLYGPFKMAAHMLD